MHREVLREEHGFAEGGDLWTAGTEQAGLGGAAASAAALPPWIEPWVFLEHAAGRKVGVHVFAVFQTRQRSI